MAILYRRSMRLLLWCCLTAGALHAASVETDVKAVLARQQEAWNRGDLRAFMEEYLNSPELTFVGKSVARGWQATLERYQKTYPDRAAMGQLTFSEVEVHPMGKDHAWVLGRFHLERTTAGGGNAGGRYTLIFTRTKQGWKMMLDHTSAD
jgi:ketosteroid isomerase-like protein